MTRATEEQWKDFVKTIVWLDLKDFLRDTIELNRDLLEGHLSQNESCRETDEALRGRNRMARDLIQRVEGWASGDLPIIE